MCKILKSNLGCFGSYVFHFCPFRSHLYLSFFPFIFISWRLITLQYCSGFCHTLTWISHGFTCVPHPNHPLLSPSPSHPSGSSQCTCPEHLSHASNLGWWSFSPLIIYMFWCCSLKTSHPRLLPESKSLFSFKFITFTFVLTLLKLNSSSPYKKRRKLWFQLYSPFSSSLLLSPVCVSCSVVSDSLQPHGL